MHQKKPKNSAHTKAKAILTMVCASALFTAAIVASVIGQHYLNVSLISSLPFAVTATVCLPLSLVLFQETDSMFDAHAAHKQEEKNKERFK